MNLNLQGKVALVAASSQGLGKAIAAQLLLEGANVMITSRNEQNLQLAKQELQALGQGRVEVKRADLTIAADIKELVRATRETFGPMQILINNAGGPPGGNFDTLSDEDWQHAFELNLLSYVRLIREALPDLRRNGGRIVNLTSSSVKQPIPGLMLSNAFRMGVVGLSKTLADELAADHILVNTVAPGRIATDRLHYIDQMNADKQGVSKEQIAAETLKSIPLGRYGDPEEFAKVVAFLVSDACTFITGSTLLIDGGMVRSY